MSELEKYQPPRAGVGDAAHAVVKAGLSSIPIVGGAATELFNAFITPPIERRRHAWMEEVGNALQKLEAEGGVQLEELQADETFYDQIWRDLYQRGLVNTEHMHVTMTATGMMSRRTTALGDQFLRFIEEPV